MLCFGFYVIKLQYLFVVNKVRDFKLKTRGLRFLVFQIGTYLFIIIMLEYTYIIYYNVGYLNGLPF